MAIAFHFFSQYLHFAESNGKLPHLLIPSKTTTFVPEFEVEDLPLGITAALVPEFAVKDLPLGRTLWWWWWWCWWWLTFYEIYYPTHLPTSPLYCQQQKRDFKVYERRVSRHPAHLAPVTEPGTTRILVFITFLIVLPTPSLLIQMFTYCTVSKMDS